ncbi:hypothetical protein PTSG_11373 [Salpingoeca rosetta]|uniref:ATP-grasp domain-containing protein n=1 Tax=Salpingoeca rosetta (strain ATCC 50818 / BSB-021) TaxID=946362 RepID=F2UT77_SALR5|nr:uncharacterized protein PTSG_11373 [Salpingoeca rosetta]EGD81336.1 hypothetical protein PTSG_11373 [Salpingoeca rosetta]|eukprot:XP_004987633.1 hypothetical protein PTSG_11373 [Salpingoeca rosetta]
MVAQACLCLLLHNEGGRGQVQDGRTRCHHATTPIAASLLACLRFFFCLLHLFLCGLLLASPLMHLPWRPLCRLPFSRPLLWRYTQHHQPHTSAHCVKGQTMDENVAQVAAQQHSSAQKLDVAVLLADPNVYDPGWTPHDDEDLAGLKEALENIPDVRISYLNDHASLISTFQTRPPAFIFNLCDEGFMNVNETEPHLPALMEVFNIPFTGTSVHGLTICRDKALVRTIAEQAGVPVPKEVVVPFAEGTPPTDDQLSTAAAAVGYPCIVKPRSSDGSTGITQQCVAHDLQQLRGAIDAAMAEIKQDMLVQTFLPGREFTVSCVGNPSTGDFEVLPLLEIDYSHLKGDGPRVQLFDGKRGLIDDYWTQVTHTHGHVDTAVLAALHTWCSKLFEELQLKDYCRMDFRMDAHGDMHLLDVNPNNWIGGKFRRSGELAGMTWPQLLRRVIDTTRRRFGLPLGVDTPPRASETSVDTASCEAIVARITSSASFPAALITSALQRFAHHPRQLSAIMQAAADAAVAANGTHQRFSAPVPRADPVKKRTMHGDTRTDEYTWMHDVDSDEFQDHIDAECTYSEQLMAHREPLIERIAKELKERSQFSKPLKVEAHGFAYCTICPPECVYPLHCRVRVRNHATDSAPLIDRIRAAMREPDDDVGDGDDDGVKDGVQLIEKSDVLVLLDENELAQGHDVFAVGNVVISPTGDLIAFTVDVTGDETYALYVRDIATQSVVRTIGGVFGRFDFAACGRRIVYVCSGPDDTSMGSRVCLHNLDAPKEQQDVVLYEEEDSAFQVTIDTTSSRELFLITASSQSTSEVHFMPTAVTQDTKPKVVLQRREGVEYSVDHMGDHVYVCTNEGGADNFKVLATTLATCSDPAAYSLVLQDRAFVKIEAIEAFADFIVAFERSHGDKHIRVMRRNGVNCPLDHYIHFPSRLHSQWRRSEGLDPIVGQKLTVSMHHRDPNVLSFFYSSLRLPTELST